TRWSLRRAGSSRYLILARARDLEAVPLLQLQTPLHDLVQLGRSPSPVVSLGVLDLEHVLPLSGPGNHSGLGPPRFSGLALSNMRRNESPALADDRHLHCQSSMLRL